MARALCHFGCDGWTRNEGVPRSCHSIGEQQTTKYLLILRTTLLLYSRSLARSMIEEAPSDGEDDAWLSVCTWKRQRPRS